MKDNSFEYRYTASEQEEIKSIRDKYAPKETEPLSGIELLQALDASVNKRANAVSIGVGTVGVLVLGSGMSLAMTDIYLALGMTAELAMPVGIAIGVLGIVLCALAYPIYKRVLARERKRLAPQIMKLTDELMK